MLLIILAVAFAISFATLQGQGQNEKRAKKTAIAVLRSQDQIQSTPSEQEDIDADQLPLTEYMASKSSDLKRKAKDVRYKKRFPTPISASGDELPANSTLHWWAGLSALPADKSDAVVIGQITDAQAFLTDDNTGLYSEFSVRITEVLKDNGSNHLTDSIVVERVGGAVKFPNGRIKQFRFNGQEMPRVGRQYVLFLKSNGQGQDYIILTGYELRAGRVFPLDGRGGKLLFSRYAGFDQTAFMTEVRDAIEVSSQTSVRQ
ncbi:MAG: hypothetical protein QOH25_776 [Acidobacteriota bacterium]|jgi:hypothetical protein|nr:hypothetical protein [Acidobacteriota bacterium]